MAFDSAIFILDQFTDLSVYCATISTYIKIGTFVRFLFSLFGCAIFFLLISFHVFMQISDCETNSPISKKSFSIFYVLRFYTFNICSKNFQNNGFSAFSAINLLKIK